MTRLRFTTDARRDLDTILEFIASDNPSVARRFVGEIRQKCSLLADMPDMGRPRPTISPTIRSFVFQHYTIYYRPLDNTVQIVRVLHQARDLSRQHFPEA